MNIKRIIDKNNKLIWYIALIIVFVLFSIKLLNSYYEKDEERKKIEIINNEKNQTTQNTTEIEQTNNSVESDSIEKTMKSFVNYCNNREIENAYKILTDECKNAMFPTIDYLEKNYIDKIYNINRTYEMVKWSTDENKTTYLVKLYGDLLSTGGTDNNYTEDYYTFVEDDNGIYKLNINNYIYGEDKNIEETKQNITIKIGHVDVYEEYEKAKITIINNTLKTICITGNKNNKNIYLQNAKNTTYSSLNSKFDSEEIVLKPNGIQTLWVEFNKVYSSTNEAQYLVLSDVILDYEDYLNSEDKDTYSYRTSIKVQYQK